MTKYKKRFEVKSSINKKNYYMLNKSKMQNARRYACYASITKRNEIDVDVDDKRAVYKLANMECL